MCGNPLIPSLLLAQDPFGDLLKKLMNQIHQQLDMPGLSQQFGTQMYEQQVVQMRKDGERQLGKACLGGASILEARPVWKNLPTLDPVSLPYSG